MICAFEQGVAGVGDLDRMLQHRVVERLVERDDKRVARAGCRWYHFPALGIGLLVVAGCDAKRFAETLRQRSAVGILPRSVDLNCEIIARKERRTDFFVRYQVAFDAARVEQHRQPLAAVIPQFFGKLQKRQLDRFAGRVEQVDVPVAVAAAHGGREVQVELQQVFWKYVGRGIDVA